MGVAGSGCLAMAASLACALAFGVEVEYAGKDPAAEFAAKEARECLTGAEGRIVLREDPALDAQEWRLRTAADGTLVISGQDGMGLAYGVYSFLEKHAGCRWYAPDVTVIPDRTGWSIPTVDERGRPAILDRTMYVGPDSVGPGSQGWRWRLRNKETQYAAYGCGVFFGKPKDCHSFAVYAQAVKAAGKPVKGDEFCLTDPEIRHIVAERMKAYIREDRAQRKGCRAREIPSVYELSQNDGGREFTCTCANCRALFRAAGSWSGPNIAFANAVAEEVGREFPDVKVRTFAYSYTEKAPKDGFKAADNLIVRYCRSFVFQPLTAETPNGKGLADWDKCVNEKYAWGYWRSYSGPLFPLVKPRADIEGEFRFCRDMKVCGYFAEAERPYDRAFSFLQAYLALKMMENPDHDVGKMSRAFMKAYYGKAEKPMEDYLSYLERREREEYAKIDPAFIASVNSGYLAMFTERGFLDDAFFATVDGYLAEAERAAQGDAQVSERIARERRIFENAKADRYVWRPEAIGQNGRERGHPQLIVKDPEARRGYAVCDAVGKVEGDYTITLMDDWTGEKSEFRLKPDEIPWNRPYRLYKAGSISLVCESWIGFNGEKFYNWVPYFGHRTEKRDVWVSMKFKDGNAYYDGLWFVPVGDDPRPKKVTDTVNLLENGDLKRHWYVWTQGGQSFVPDYRR